MKRLVVDSHLLVSSSSQMGVGWHSGPLWGHENTSHPVLGSREAVVLTLTSWSPLRPVSFVTVWNSPWFWNSLLLSGKFQSWWELGRSMPLRDESKYKDLNLKLSEKVNRMRWGSDMVSRCCFLTLARLKFLRLSARPETPGLFYRGVLFLVVQDGYMSSSYQIEVLQFHLQWKVQ